MTGLVRGSGLGLVLSGGFLRGAFQVGVIEALHARGLRFDVVVGVSSGAWNAACVATGQIAAPSGEVILSLLDPALKVAPTVVNQATEHGLILRATPADGVAVCPPLIITEEEIEELRHKYQGWQSVVEKKPLIDARKPHVAFTLGAMGSPKIPSQSSHSMEPMATYCANMSQTSQ